MSISKPTKMTMNRPYDNTVGRESEEQKGERRTSIPKVRVPSFGTAYQACGGGRRVIKISSRY